MWRILNVLVCLTLLLSQRTVSWTARAQDGSLVPFYAANTVSNAAWSSDSRRFAFGATTFSSDSDAGHGQWYVYDINTDTVTEAKNWPFQPPLQLTKSLSSYINPEVAEGKDFAYLSPNGQFLVTAGIARTGKPATPITYPTVVADVQHNRVFEVPLAVPAFNRDPFRFQVKWSDDSSAFTLGTAPALEADPSTFTYVSGFAAKTPHLISHDFSVFNYEGHAYNPEGVYDISADGSRVLIQSIEGASPIQYPIFIWDVHSDTYQKIDGLSLGSHLVTDAMFNSDSTAFYIINNKGFIRYEWLTGLSTVLDATINTQWVDEAFFSPDGRSLILFDNVQSSDGVMTKMYLVKLATLTGGHNGSE